MTIDQNMKAAGIELPSAPVSVANYVGAVTTGNLVFVSGHGPVLDGELAYIGKVGDRYTTQEGYEAARLTMLNCLSTLRNEIGSLDRVVRVVKLLGMVNSGPDFVEQPAVINGASDLLTQVFGDRIGRHARSAISMPSLPFAQSIEIEMIVEVSDEQ